MSKYLSREGAEKLIDLTKEKLFELSSELGTKVVKQYDLSTSYKYYFPIYIPKGKTVKFSLVE